MSTSRDMVTALKAELRRAGITYARLARELGLAESSVKRILARGDLSLARIDQILALLQMDFAELARQVAAARPPRQELTLAQERAVVADPKLLLVAICALSQWTVDEIVRTYTLHKAQVVAALLALDRLGILKLHAHDRYRLLIDKTFRWRPHGPVMQFFRSHAVVDYYDGGFDGEGELLLLVHGQIQRAQAHAFNDRLQRLAQDFAHQHLADRALPAAEREAYTLVIGMRSWLFTPFRAMLREGAELA
jgi:transcriptional regulator with XRE-family HTH domain